MSTSTLGSSDSSSFALHKLPLSEMSSEGFSADADSAWRRLKPYRGPQTNVFEQQMVPSLAGAPTSSAASKSRAGRQARQQNHHNNHQQLVFHQTQQAAPLDQWASEIEAVQVASGGIYAATWTGAHNSADYIAFANSSRSKAEFRVYKPAYQQQGQQSSSSATASLKLDLVSSIKFPVAAKGSGSCGWYDNHVALPARDGSVAVFQWRKSSHSAGPVPIEEPSLATTLTYNSVPSSAPLATPRASQATGAGSHSPLLPQWCLSVDMVGNQVVGTRASENIVWNLERPNQPIWVRKVQTLTTGAPVAPPFGRIVKWAPATLWPQQANYARGGLDGSVKLFDIRQPSDSEAALVWANPLSTLGTGGGCAINSMAWCPFVGWWLCTAREDGVVSLWDLRWNGAAAVEIHNAPPQITDISWSPNSIDFIGISSLLRSSSALSVWNLRLPEHAVASISTTVAAAQKNEIGEDASNPLSTAPPMGGCCFIPGVSAVAPLLGVSASGGQLLSLRVNLEQMKRLSPLQPPIDSAAASPIPPNASSVAAAVLLKAPPKNKSVLTIEQNIYVRQFGVAFRAALELALSLRAEGRTQEANMVLANCYQRVGPEGLPPAIPRPAPAPGMVPAASSTVPATEYASSTKAQLEFYSYYIPPNYPDVMWPAVDPAVMFDIEILKMNLELEILKPHELERSTDDIIEFLNRSITTIDAQLLLKTLQTLRTSASFIAALNLGANVAKTYSEWLSGKNSTSNVPGLGARTGLFNPATTLVDTDGLGVLYFLNLMNAVMWPTLFESSDDYTAGKSFKVGAATSRGASASPASTISWTTSPEYSPIWGQNDLKITPEKLEKQLFLMKDFLAALWGSSKTSYVAHAPIYLFELRHKLNFVVSW